MKTFLIVALVLLVLLLPNFFIWAIIAIFAIWKIGEALYFRSDGFSKIKSKVASHVSDCNSLNQHIAELKEAGLVDNRADCGNATYRDTSKWAMKRKELSAKKYAPYRYDCSRAVCDGAQKEPFKYICKYFGIEANEDTLEQFEAILNSFEAAEDGKESLKAERSNIILSIEKDVPFLIRKFRYKKLEKQLGFEPVDFSTVYFPRYIFKYTSSGGNASTQCDIVMDIDNLNRFVTYLSDKIKFKKSAAGQRALMTSRLRQQIKERDKYTCKSCGISIEQEPHLLLEIDHIIPVSKGGSTTESNLQTLCWRCNRSKGAKL